MNLLDVYDVGQVVMKDLHLFGDSTAERQRDDRPQIGKRRIDLPPAEWPRDYDSLDHERDDECQARSTSQKRLSASCVKLR